MQHGEIVSTTLGVGAEPDYKLEVIEDVTAMSGSYYTFRNEFFSNTTGDDSFARSPTLNELIIAGASNLTGITAGSLNLVVHNGDAGNVDTLYGSIFDIAKGVGTSVLTNMIGLGLETAGGATNHYAFEIADGFMTGTGINVLSEAVDLFIPTSTSDFTTSDGGMLFNDTTDGLSVASDVIYDSGTGDVTIANQLGINTASSLTQELEVVGKVAIGNIEGRFGKWGTYLDVYANSAVTLYDDVSTLAATYAAFGNGAANSGSASLALATAQNSHSNATPKFVMMNYDSSYTGTSKTGIIGALVGQGATTTVTGGGGIGLAYSTDGLTDTVGLSLFNDGVVSIPGNLGIGFDETPISNLHVFTGTAPATAMTDIVNRGVAITSDTIGRDGLYFENTSSTSGSRVLVQENFSDVFRMSSLNDAATAFAVPNILTMELATGHIGLNTDNATDSTRLTIKGSNGFSNGPNIALTTDADVYPVMHWISDEHDSVIQLWNAYYDGSVRASITGDVFRMGAFATGFFEIAVADGTAGAIASWDSAMRINFTETEFNTSSDDRDFIVRSSNDSSAFHLLGSNGSIGLGTSIPSVPLHLQKNGLTYTPSPIGNEVIDVQAIFQPKSTTGEEANVLLIGATNANTSAKQAGIYLGNYDNDVPTTHWLGHMYGMVDDAVDNDGSFHIDVFTSGLESGRKSGLVIDQQADATFGASLVATDEIGGAHVEITDGVTAPGTTAGIAKLYVDSADGDLKIKFGDGTVKTITTDT